MSASICPAQGPARTRASSMTLMPDSGRFDFSIVHSLPGGAGTRPDAGPFARFPLDNKKLPGTIAGARGEIMTAQTDMMPAAPFCAAGRRQIGVETGGIVAVLLSLRSRQMT
ncbi:hypothetical protein GCM10007923_50620 [Shinella yambaruensis]|uniref:Uncharacterized protein n=1 Tax=Shinella yambaruensis TaxID=415996 RepID=A0ABQ5ZS31_9HYPH|nr:hypothetical protein GCM10007923_50620 [Shinella yambaruensis]